MEDTKKEETDDVEFLDEVNYSYRKQTYQKKQQYTWSDQPITDQEYERIRNKVDLDENI
jgi:hypothetical protein